MIFPPPPRFGPPLFPGLQEIFDAFEGDDYIKTPVTILVSEASPHLPTGEHQAWAYVW
jgi:hypothetical protein